MWSGGSSSGYRISIYTLSYLKGTESEASRVASAVCPPSQGHHRNKEPSFALQPGGQQAIEAGCNKDLDIINTIWECGYEVFKGALVVTGSLKIIVYLQEWVSCRTW